MKLDFDTVLTDADDKPIIESDKPISVLTLLKRAVLADITPAGEAIPAIEKVKRFELFLKLKFADNTTDFSIDEVKLMDDAILVFGTLIAGQLHYVLTQK
jgi:hypothetical protein